MKSKNVICFSQQELLNLFCVAKKMELIKEINSQNLTIDDLNSNFKKRNEMAKIIGQRSVEDRDEHEIFGAVFEIVNFYEKDSKVCFEMQSGFNPNKDKIQNLKDLNKFRNGTFSDFIVSSKDSFRYFQMKRYRGRLNTQEIFDFIKSKIKHYANNLGNVNFLLILQSSDDDISVVNFLEIYKELKQLSFSSNGHVLIFYNENNKFSVLNTVYPTLGTTRIPWRSASSKLNNLNKK